MAKKSAPTKAVTKRSPRKKPKPSTALATLPKSLIKGGEPLEPVLAARELFWQNVIREMLTSLSVMTAQKSATDPGSIFDGRLAIITKLGQRIPIAGVIPLFACGVQTTKAEQALAMAVECSVFQINTPEGEVFTLPLHEIRSFHSLSEALIEQLAKSAQTEENPDGEPFGFAAYTSMARTRLPGAYGVVPSRYPLNPSDE